MPRRRKANAAGADVVGFDIGGPVSSALDVTPTTLVDLAETGCLVQDVGTRWHQKQLVKVT